MFNIYLLKKCYIIMDIYRTSHQVKSSTRWIFESKGLLRLQMCPELTSLCAFLWLSKIKAVRDHSHFASSNKFDKGISLFLVLLSIQKKARKSGKYNGCARWMQTKSRRVYANSEWIRTNSKWMRKNSKCLCEQTLSWWAQTLRKWGIWPLEINITPDILVPFHL